VDPNFHLLKFGPDPDAAIFALDLFGGFFVIDAGPAALGGVHIPSNLGIGITSVGVALDVNGDVQANNFITVSDARFKDNIETISNASDKLSQLRGVTYNFKQEEIAGRTFDGSDQIGFIAQEVEQVFPELVVTHENGYKGVNYQGLIPVIVEALKDNQAAVEEIETKLETGVSGTGITGNVATEEIAAIKAENQQLKAQVAVLESKVAEIDDIKRTLARFDQSLAQCCIDHQSDNRGINNIEDASLGQNIPNPFKNSTIISYYLPSNTNDAMMRIADITGKVVNEYLLEGEGFGQVEFKDSEISNGTYLYSLIVNGHVIDTKQMVLSR
jgi:hypothetical protein